MPYTALFLAVLLLAAAPPGERFDTADAFRSVLPAEHARLLSGENDLNALAAALSPEQRDAAGVKLREAEGRTNDPRDLAAIHRGYLALKDAGGAWRVGDSLVERFPQAAAGFVMRGQVAELRGDMAGAEAQAREALRRDPRAPAAFALLKLSEGRSSSASSASGATPAEAGFSVGEFDTSPRTGASPEALAMMEKAVDARWKRDFTRARAYAQAAMNADPKSLAAQRFYEAMEEDSRKVSRERVGVYAAIQQHEAESRARREAAADLAAARRAARRNQIPPIAPLSAGALLLTLGIMAWNHGLREEALRRADETRRVAAAALIVSGCAGMAYGAASYIVSGSRILPPALKLAGEAGVLGRAAVTAEAAAAESTALGAAAAAGGGELAGGDSKYSSEEAVRSGESQGPRIIFKSEHAARHLKGTNLSSEEVEKAIAESIRMNTTAGNSSGSFLGRITIRGQSIEYRAYRLTQDHINVGTYYPVEP